MMKGFIVCFENPSLNEIVFVRKLPTLTNFILKYERIDNNAKDFSEFLFETAEDALQAVDKLKVEFEGFLKDKMIQILQFKQDTTIEPLADESIRAAQMVRKSRA
jgi:hypothetical protein